MSALFNPTVGWITLRATLSRRRALLFALPAAILILLTVAQLTQLTHHRLPDVLPLTKTDRTRHPFTPNDPRVPHVRSS
jgi:hypothetical protein